MKQNYKMTELKPFGALIEANEPNTDIADLDIQSLKNLFHEKQFILIRGFKAFNHSDKFADYCEKWGEVSIWPFGKVLELIERENPEDHIFDNNYVPLHWDGMYRPQIAEYQIFHCVEAPLKDQGGRTTFSHTPLALKNASEETRNLWSKVTGSYERKMEFYHSKTISPIITKHPHKDFSVIRYNEPNSTEGDFLNPPNLHFSGVSEEELAHFHSSLKEALYHPSNFYAHEWQVGDVVIADNFSLLHGREKFTSKAPRHLQRVHVLSTTPFNNPGLVSHK